MLFVNLSWINRREKEPEPYNLEVIQTLCTNSTKALYCLYKSSVLVVQSLYNFDIEYLYVIR